MKRLLGVLFILLPAADGHAARAPRWVSQPPPDNSAALFFVGAASEMPSEQEARKAAFSSALDEAAARLHLKHKSFYKSLRDEFGTRIMDEKRTSAEADLIGVRIAQSHIEKTLDKSTGKASYTAHLLVEYPRDAFKRWKEQAAAKAQARLGAAAKSLAACRKLNGPAKVLNRLRRVFRDLEEAEEGGELSSSLNSDLAELKGEAQGFAASFLAGLSLDPVQDRPAVQARFKSRPLAGAPIMFHAEGEGEEFDASTKDRESSTDSQGIAEAGQDFQRRAKGGVYADFGIPGVSQPRAVLSAGSRSKLGFFIQESGYGSKNPSSLQALLVSLARENGYSPADMRRGLRPGEAQPLSDEDLEKLSEEALDEEAGASEGGAAKSPADIPEDKLLDAAKREGMAYLVIASLEAGSDCDRIRDSYHVCDASGWAKVMDPASGTELSHVQEKFRDAGRNMADAGRKSLGGLARKLAEKLRGESGLFSNPSRRETR